VVKLATHHHHLSPHASTTFRNAFPPNDNNNFSSNMATMNSHEQLYEKLNNVHASLRKEKEDAYRSKQLAEQRLQLARSDREAAERKGSETVTQLRQLKEKAIEIKKVNAIVEAEIRLMEKEVRMVCCVRCPFPSPLTMLNSPPPRFIAILFTSSWKL
jgi:hypothetical protein